MKQVVQYKPSLKQLRLKLHQSYRFTLETNIVCQSNPGINSKNNFFTEINSIRLINVVSVWLHMGLIN